MGRDFTPDVNNQEHESNPSGCQGLTSHCSNMQSSMSIQDTHIHCYNGENTPFP
jgi:hypothetical protein